MRRLLLYKSGKELRTFRQPANGGEKGLLFRKRPLRDVIIKLNKS